MKHVDVYVIFAICFQMMHVKYIFHTYYPAQLLII